MMISNPKQVAIPKATEGDLGINPNTDAGGHAPTNGEKPLNGGDGDAQHPVDRVYGILGKPGSVDEYLEQIRGR